MTKVAPTKPYSLIAIPYNNRTRKHKWRAMITLEEESTNP